LKRFVPVVPFRQEVSRPARARGLKRVHHPKNHREVDVAPRTGAWIETSNLEQAVTSLTSRPARARGLKRVG